MTLLLGFGFKLKHVFKTFPNNDKNTCMISPPSSRRQSLPME